MHIQPMTIPDVLLITPKVHHDERGFFMESFNQRLFNQAINHCVTFVQDNISHSSQGVLRGLHYQIKQPQGKLVQVLHGQIFDVVVDLRQSSPTFRQWLGYELTAESRQQLWIPPGFAHGFIALSKTAEIFYKTTGYYAPADERCIQWNDPELAIAWPTQKTPLLSDKDTKGAALALAELFD